MITEIAESTESSPITDAAESTTEGPNTEESVSLEENDEELNQNLWKVIPLQKSIEKGDVSCCSVL